MWRVRSVRVSVLVRVALSIGVFLWLNACRPEESRSTGSADVKTGPAPTAAEANLPADDGQWVRPAKDFASTRYSSLTEINATNVKNLRTDRDVLDRVSHAVTNRRRSLSAARCTS
jgi:glucose dehydrogenase